PISPALWQRIKTNGQKIGLDSRLGTELGRLALHDELTSAEVSAGFRIAEIYQTFERFHGRTRSAAGSSFFRQFVANTEKPMEIGRRKTDDCLEIDREGSRAGGSRGLRRPPILHAAGSTRPGRASMCRERNEEFASLS